MSTAKTLRCSEIFESIQGEGHSAGVASVFLRLAVCNLRCSWCDTKYTWDWSRNIRYEDGRSANQAVADVTHASPRRALAAAHLVVTGGEPLLQQPALASALRCSSGRPIHRGRNERHRSLPVRSYARASQSVENVSPKLAGKQRRDTESVASSSISSPRRSSATEPRLAEKLRRRIDDADLAESRRGSSPTPNGPKAPRALHAPGDLARRTDAPGSASSPRRKGLAA